MDPRCARCQHPVSVHRPTFAGYHCRLCRCKRRFLGPLYDGLILAALFGWAQSMVQ